MICGRSFYLKSSANAKWLWVYHLIPKHWSTCLFCVVVYCISWRITIQRPCHGICPSIVAKQIQVYDGGSFDFVPNCLGVCLGRDFYHQNTGGRIWQKACWKNTSPTGWCQEGHTSLDSLGVAKEENERKTGRKGKAGKRSCRRVDTTRLEYEQQLLKLQHHWQKKSRWQNSWNIDHVAIQTNHYG